MTSTNTRLLAGGAAALALAAGLGFGVARLTAPGAPTAPAAPKAEDSKTAKDTLTMTPAVLQASGIKVEAASTGGLNDEILASATVAAAPDGQAVLTAHAQGAVTRIYKQLGDPVRAGEIVALVESREAASIAAERSVAAAKAALARQVLTRELRLFEQRVSPRQDVERAQAESTAAAAEVRRAQAAAGAARVAADGRSVMVTSPIGGRITSAPAALGAFIQSETELFRVADPQRIQVQAAVPAAEAQRIVPGDPAFVEVPGGRSLAATVRAVTPTLNAETRAATVVLTLASLDGLQPGQLVRARIRPRSATLRTGVVVADEAVQSIGGRDAVFVRTPEGFRVQSVTLGSRGGGRAEIAAGLNGGQMVATRNAFLLKAELEKGAADEE
ncbi:MAG TPA: efflux RND transporter periplasmic adaptor subunit [Caulobacteraceae bacterium]|jgi:cobalt-zinc-cadmium efflux system membrane fusion protein|nr:efflux RND transporter periplasmic adaptor subunit [Caulobacteraceae bacterium]